MFFDNLTTDEIGLDCFPDAGESLPERSRLASL